MRLSPRIWKELGDLARHVELVNHDQGTVQFRAGVSEEDQNAVLAVVDAHDPNSTAKFPDEIADKAREKLVDIDLRSIRAIREYLVAKPDSPPILKDLEAEAIAERAKLNT